MKKTPSENIIWLLNCPPSDLNWESRRKKASLKELKYVLRNWRRKGITGKKKIEAEIRIRERKLKKLGLNSELK